MGPEIGTDEQVFVAKAPGIMEKLVAAFDIQNYQAAGESWAISAMNPTVFESCRKCFPQEVLDAAASAGRSGPAPAASHSKSFCADQGLNTTSDAANFGYL